MEQSSKNENTCDIYMNEVKMEYEPLLELQENINLQENENLQIEGSRNPKMNEEKMKKNLKMLHAHKSSWRGNNRNALCWAFYCVNDNKEVNVTTPQTIHCIFCHSNSILNFN
jgi:hypothetical protein